MQSRTDVQCSQPTLTFTHGILIGQLSLIILAVAFVRYVVFEDPSPSQIEPAGTRGGPRSFDALEHKGKKRRRRAPSSATSAAAFAASTAAAAHRRMPSSDNHILSGLGYDISTHASESADWFNVIMAQVIEAYRTAVHTTVTPETGGKGLIEEILNFHRPKEEGFVTIDHIGVDDVDLGEDFPTISNARVRPSEDGGRVRIEIDVDYTDQVTIGVDTKVLINVPRPRFAVLPIRLGLTLLRFSATIAIEVPPLTPDLPPSALVSLHPDFTLSMRTTSLIGSRAKLQDIPKIEQLIMARVRGWMTDHIVWPHKLAIPLPKVLAPRLNEDEPPLQPGHDYDWIDESKQAEGMPSSQNGEAPQEAGSDEEEDAELGGAIRVKSPRLPQDAVRGSDGSSGASASRLYPPGTRMPYRRQYSGSSSASSGAENRFATSSQGTTAKLPGRYASSSALRPANLPDLRARTKFSSVDLSRPVMS